MSLRIAPPGQTWVFPLKVWLELNNASRVDAVLHSGFFRFENDVKPHPKLRCCDSGREAELWFPGKDNRHTETEFLLKSGRSITTFTALSAEFDMTAIQDLMEGKNVGGFNITGTWLGDAPTVRHYKFQA